MHKNKLNRTSFSKIPSLVEMPDFLSLQKDSFERFLQLEAVEEEREYMGLEGVFQDVFPLEDSHRNYILEYNNYFLGLPKYSADECIDRGVTYSVPLKVRLTLNITDEENKSEFAQSIQQDVYFGNIPAMTEKGTFVINGAERVIVSQLHRSPGVFFDDAMHPNGAKLYQARIIPFRGSWLDFTTDINDALFAIIDRRRKFPVTMLLRALGFSTNKDIFNAFNCLKQISLKSKKEFEGKNFSEFKEKLSDLVIDKIGPISEEIKKLLNDNKYLDDILVEGSKKANEIAYKKIKEMKKLIGF